MATKLVYAYHPVTKAFSHIITLDESDMSPMEPDKFLIPAGATVMPLPTIPSGKFAEWDGGKWTLKSIPVEPEPAPAPSVPTAPPAPAVDPVVALTSLLQNRMDVMAQSVGYDDIKTAITYRGDPNLLFAMQAEAFFEWRSAVWTQAYAYLDGVKLGKHSFPTFDETLAMMPTISIPTKV